MRSLVRRSFLKSAAAPLAFSALEPSQAAAQSAEGPVLFMGDGLSLSPAQYASLLTSITAKDSFRRDTYLASGPVEELEHAMATTLGKERAVFLPTGTLANHLAVRLLAGETRKALVQAESHLYRDEGDCAQLLSGLNLVPLAPGRTTFTAAEAAKAVEEAAGPPYPAPVGAISIESPVRRTSGGVFDFEEMKKICAYARERKIGTHLDGARMFLASAYTGITPAQYAALFDTVYVSMYKYFNAPFGAILTGPAPLIARVETLRHQFGSAIYQGWESAAVALHHLNGFSERYQKAVRNGEKLFELLESSGKFQIIRVPSGSNIARLRLASGGTLDQLRDRLGEAGIRIGAAKAATEANVQINETINRRGAEELARAFLAAAG
ncbi:MAG TPA: beta-eliminating lyase-related protein [Bryobacteraceae bacterium]|nr:beta-eliminating lyase-related protein [Bryobacteraceae bacterium]